MNVLKKSLAGLLPALLIACMMAGCGSDAIDAHDAVEEGESGSTAFITAEMSSAPEESQGQNNPESEPPGESASESSEQAARATPASRGVIYGDWDIFEGSGEHERMYDELGVVAGSNSRLGTQEELDSIKAFLAGLKADAVTWLLADIIIEDPENTIHTMSDAEIAELVGLLGDLEPALEDLESPTMGGGCSVYLETTQGNVLLSFTHQFSVTYPHTGVRLVFRAEHAKEQFSAVWYYLAEKLGYTPSPVELAGPGEFDEHLMRYDRNWMVSIDVKTSTGSRPRIELNREDSQIFVDGFTFSRFTYNRPIDATSETGWNGAGDYMTVTFENEYDTLKLTIYQTIDKALGDNEGTYELYDVENGTWEAAAAYVEYFRAGNEIP